MATLEQLDIIDIIQEKRDEAKEKHIGVAKYLSGGREQYKTAINTIISVSALAIVSSAINILLAAFGLGSMLAQNVPMSTLDWVIAVSEMAVYVTTLSISFKLYYLNATPIFVLSSLIFILVTNAVFFMSITPCLTVILAIIGLICWGTYRNWFENVAKTLTKGGKKHDTAALRSKQKGSKKSNTLWVIAVSVLSIVAIGGSIGFYFLGKSQGRDGGYRDGYNNGYNAGKSAGYTSGQNDGYNSGRRYGYDEGYNQGYHDMWEKANCIINGGGYSCL